MTGGGKKGKWEEMRMAAEMYARCRLYGEGTEPGEKQWKTTI